MYLPKSESEYSTMMSIPFFGLTAAFAFVFAGRRNAALALFALSMVCLLVLFKLHATDPLNIVL
jgi:hypothetical protein